MAPVYGRKVGDWLTPVALSPSLDRLAELVEALTFFQGPKRKTQAFGKLRPNGA
jgi:hypothetical protein